MKLIATTGLLARALSMSAAFAGPIINLATSLGPVLALAVERHE